jgi:hypothetical protein
VADTSSLLLRLVRLRACSACSLLLRLWTCACDRQIHSRDSSPEGRCGPSLLLAAGVVVVVVVVVLQAHPSAVWWQQPAARHLALGGARQFVKSRFVIEGRLQRFLAPPKLRSWPGHILAAHSSHSRRNGLSPSEITVDAALPSQLQPSCTQHSCN